MDKSESIKELCAALVKVQAALTPVKRNAENPFFRSDYADLAAVWEHIRPLLAKNGLAISQTTDGDKLITTLMHISGEYLSGVYPMVCNKPNDPQALGSSMTYARRYALAAIVGVVTEGEDDDGNNASLPGKVDKSRAKSTTTQAADDQRGADVPPAAGQSSRPPTASAPEPSAHTLNEGEAVVEARLEEIPEPKTGKRNGRAWTFWNVVTSQGKFGTFDKDLISDAETLVGEIVQIIYKTETKPDGKTFKTAVSIYPVIDTPKDTDAKPDNLPF